VPQDGQDIALRPGGTAEQRGQAMMTGKYIWRVPVRQNGFTPEQNKTPNHRLVVGR
jgi:hypothetical protein